MPDRRLDTGAIIDTEGIRRALSETAYQRAIRIAEANKAARNAQKPDGWREVDWRQMIELLEIETVSRPTELAAFIALHFRAKQRSRGAILFEPQIYEPPTDRDGQQMKYCGRCGEWRPRWHYSADQARRDGLKAWCRDCYAAYERERYHLRKTG